MLGDHIRVLRAGRWTHAIDVGGQQVIHLTDGRGLAPGVRLRRSYRPDFTAGAERVEVVIHRERTYPAKVIAARAWNRLAEPAVAAAFRDSEQFAAWCAIGRMPPPAPPPPAPARSKVKAAPAKVKAAAQPAARAAPKAKKAAKPAAKPAAKAARKPAPKVKAKGGAGSKPKAKVKAKAPARAKAQPKAKPSRRPAPKAKGRRR